MEVRYSIPLLGQYFIDQSLGTWSRKISHSSVRHCNNSDENYEEEGIEVSLGEEICGHSYLETIHSFSINHGGHKSCGNRSQETRNSTSSNFEGRGRKSIFTIQFSFHNNRGYVDIIGSRSQDPRKPSFHNRVTRVDVEGKGGYRSQTRHYYSHNQGEHGRLLTFSGDTVGGDGRIG